MTIAQMQSRIAELIDATADLLSVYPELRDLPDDYVPSESDHWSVQMYCTTGEEIGDLSAGGSR